MALKPFFRVRERIAYYCQQFTKWVYDEDCQLFPPGFVNWLTDFSFWLVSDMKHLWAFDADTFMPTLKWTFIELHTGDVQEKTYFG